MSNCCMSEITKEILHPLKFRYTPSQRWQHYLSLAERRSVTRADLEWLAAHDHDFSALPRGIRDEVIFAQRAAGPQDYLASGRPL